MKMLGRSINVLGMFAQMTLSNREKKFLTPQTFPVTVKLSKAEYCEKCFGDMKKDPEVGWEQVGRGNISGFDVHKFVCEKCGHEHTEKIGRD